MSRGFDDHELRHGEYWNHAKQQTTQAFHKYENGAQSRRFEPQHIQSA